MNKIMRIKKLKMLIIKQPSLQLTHLLQKQLFLHKPKGGKRYKKKKEKRKIYNKKI